MKKIKVEDITLLFLCRTATKKTLYIEYDKRTVCLDCEIDEDLWQSFYVDCESESDAKELQQQCVEWLNY